MQFALYTIVYTRPGQDVKKNEYLWIYLTWLWSLIHHNVLGPDDTINVIIDKPSYDFLIKQYAFNYLHNIRKIRCNYIQVEQPSSVLDGFFYKYDQRCIKIIASCYSNLSKVIFVYSDIDNIIVKPLHTLSWSEKTNTVYTVIEGPVLNKPYFGGYIPLPEEMELYNVMNDYFNSVPPYTIPGFSAGLFAFSFESKERIMHFIENIYKYKNHQKDKDIYYEQSAFNFSIYSNLINNCIEVYSDTFNIPGVLVFDNCEAVDYSIISLMGDAGNGSFHMDKCMGFLFNQLELSKRN